MDQKTGGSPAQAETASNQKSQLSFVHQTFLDYLVASRFAALVTGKKWDIVRTALNTPLIGTGGQSRRSWGRGGFLRWCWLRVQRAWRRLRPLSDQDDCRAEERKFLSWLVRIIGTGSDRTAAETWRRISPFLAGELGDGSPLIEELLSSEQPVKVSHTLLRCLLECKAGLAEELKQRAFDAVLIPLDTKQNRLGGTREWYVLAADGPYEIEEVLIAARRHYREDPAAGTVVELVRAIRKEFSTVPLDKRGTYLSHRSEWDDKAEELKRSLPRGSPAAAVRWAAIWGLVALGRKEAAELVAGCLHDPSPVVRSLAARALAAFQPPNAFQLLEPLKKASGDSYARAGWASAIGRLGDRRAIADLKHLVRDRREPRAVRSAAMWALQKLAGQHDKHLAGVFAGGLEDQAEEVRASAIHGLVNCRAWRSQVLRLLASKEPDSVRCAAARAIGKLGPPDTLSDVASWLDKYDDTKNRRFVAWCWAATHQIMIRSGQTLSLRQWSSGECQRVLVSLDGYLRARHAGYWGFSESPNDSNLEEMTMNSEIENWGALGNVFLDLFGEVEKVEGHHLRTMTNFAKFLGPTWKKTAWAALAKRWDDLKNRPELASSLSYTFQALPEVVAEDRDTDLASHFKLYLRTAGLTLNPAPAWYALGSLAEAMARQQQPSSPKAVGPVPGLADQKTQEGGDGPGRVLAATVEPDRLG